MQEEWKARGKGNFANYDNMRKVSQARGKLLVLGDGQQRTTTPTPSNVNIV